MIHREYLVCVARIRAIDDHRSPPISSTQWIENGRAGHRHSRLAPNLLEQPPKQFAAAWTERVHVLRRFDDQSQQSRGFETKVAMLQPLEILKHQPRAR